MEDFVQDLFPFLSFGKLRTSFGVNRNATGIGAYTLQGSYNPVTYAGNTGFLLGTLPNPALRWGKTQTFGIGLDVCFWASKLTSNLPYYTGLARANYATFALRST